MPVFRRSGGIGRWIARRFQVVVLVLLAALPALADQVVRIAQFEHPPFAYRDSRTGEAKGWEIDYQSAVLRRFGYRAEFEFSPFPRVVELLKNGQVDAGPLVVRTPEREVFAKFSAQPVFVLTPVLVVKRECPLRKLVSRDDLAGMRIGFTARMVVPLFFGPADRRKFDLISADDYAMVNLKKLMGGRFDAYVELNPYITRFEAKSTGFGDRIRLVEIPGPQIGYSWAFSTKSDLASSLLPRIDAIPAAGRIMDPSSLELP